MKPETQFTLIFLATILIIRLFLYLFPASGPIFFDIRIHHWLLGVVIVLITLIIHKFKPNSLTIPLFALGLALFIDELTYLLINGKTHQDNYSAISLLGTALFTLGIIAIKNRF